MIVWDASREVRRNWRQNSSLSLKGEDCGVVVGVVNKYYEIIKEVSDKNINVILSEYSSSINVDENRFNRFYKRTTNELIQNYILSKIQLVDVLSCLGANVYNNTEINNFITCKCLLEQNKEPTILFSEFQEFLCMGSSSVAVNVPQEEEEKYINNVFLSLFGTYFFDKVSPVRKQTLFKYVPESVCKNLSIEEFFSMIDKGNLNLKQKQRFWEIREKVQTNYDVLTVVNPDEERLFLSSGVSVKERNKTRFKLINKKFGYKFSEDFIDSLFREINRIDDI